MGRAVSKPDVRRTISTAMSRLAQLEARLARGDTLAPVAVDAAVAVTTTPTVTHMALANANGARVTMWVRVTVSGGIMSLQLSESGGTTGDTVTASGTGVVQVSLPIDSTTWQAGQLRTLSLTCSLTGGSGAVLPLRCTVA